MAADQLNKRPKVSNVIRHTSWEMQKVKKKKFSHYDLNTKSNISLEWDSKKERVVSKKEQISIACRELIPFLPHVSHCQNVLGDVFAAPSELFELNNLTGLLSYEVWQTHLSVQEREFLTQFLPEGDDPHKIVHELFAGNNFYFGNPFPKWGASVCSGDYHPDAVIRQEQCNKANKVAYYSELQEYHTKMIGSLQLWKERWESCMNPENDFMQKILRSRKVFQKSGSSHENGTQYGPEDDLCATSGSCSWDADDKSHTSDSPDLSVGNGDTLKRRVSRIGLGRRSVARPEKGDKLRKINIECGDGAKYMSYIKVSKEQHERVKSSMRHSNTSILPRSLNNVLGNLDSFCVQPFEVFEQEERHKLHHHWSRLVKKDLPAGFENWNIWRSAKWQLTKSLTKEMEDQWKSNDEQQVLNMYNQDEEEFVVGGQDEEQEQSVSSNPCQQQLVDEETNVHLIAPEENIDGNGDSIFQSEADLNVADHEITEGSSQESDQNQCLPQIAIHNNNDNNNSSNIQNFSSMAINTSNAAFPSSLVEYTDNINHAEASVGEQFPPPSVASEIWPPPVGLPNMFYHQPASVTNGYPPSISELSLRQAQSSFLHRRSDGGDSFFNPYANQDRSELLLHSLLKDPGSSHYFHEQKLSRLGFHPTGSDTMLGTGHFPRNLCSSLPLDPRQNIQENIFADGAGGRYSIPRQEHLLPLNHVQDWPGDGVVNMPMAASSHHRLSQNWFSGDEVVSDGWSGGVVPNQDLGNGGQVADESLFSVLSECNGLRSGVHFGSTEFIQAGNFVGMGRGLVPSTTVNVIPPPRAARGGGLNYMSGNEGQLGWINLPSGGKSFGRSWNDKEL